MILQPWSFFPVANPAPLVLATHTLAGRDRLRQQIVLQEIANRRRTLASRLSAGGISDHFVTQMLRQGDADVFKRHSQAKLNMMREARARLDRRANEHSASFVTSGLN
jgi:hypothetical protein